MKKFRKWWIALAVAGVLALVGGGAVMAQTATPGSGSSGTSFLDRVAQKLGIETPKLQNAIKSAANDQIDAEVKAGQLTQAQANALKQRIANAPANAPFFGPGFGGHGPGMGRGAFGDSTALANFLGITPTQLHTELSASGATLAKVAQAHGKTRAQLKAFLTNDAKTRLQQEVTAGHITQAQADAQLSQFSANLDARIDATMPAGHDRGGWGGPMGGPGGFGAPAIPGANGSGTANNG